VLELEPKGAEKAMLALQELLQRPPFEFREFCLIVH